MLTNFTKIILIIILLVITYFFIPVSNNDGICSFFKENQYNSFDCAIFYDRLADIPAYDHFVSFRGVASNIQAGATEFAKFTLSIHPEGLTPLQMIDESKRAILVRANHQTFKDFNVLPNISSGNILDITCSLVLDDSQEPPLTFCDNPIINSVEEIGDIGQYRDYLVNLEEVDVFEGYVVTKIDNWTIKNTIYRTKHNETHFFVYDALEGNSYTESKYFFSQNKFSIDEPWDYYGNFSFWSYVLEVPEWSNFSTTSFNRFYSVERDLEFEAAENKPIVVSGWGFKNIRFAGGGLYSGMIFSELDGTLSLYNVVGDGICGELENQDNSEDCLT